MEKREYKPKNRSIATFLPLEVYEIVAQKAEAAKLSLYQLVRQVLTEWAEKNK